MNSIHDHEFNSWSSNAEANLKKSVGYKKSVYFVGTKNESMFNPFFVPLWIRSCFCVNGEKISFPRPDFVDSETAIWGLTSLTDFYKRVQLSFKKRHASDCQKKISFVQITRMKFTFLTPYDIKNVDIKIALFLFDINNEDIVISKLVSQLKLLPSLIELKDY